MQTCRRCGKELTNEKSKALGIGPECLKKSVVDEHARRLFDMGKGKRIKSHNKELEKTKSDGIQLAVNAYTAAVLWTCKTHLKLGPKRAQLFADAIQDQFNAIVSGQVSFDEISKLVNDELGITIKLRNDAQ